MEEQQHTEEGVLEELPKPGDLIGGKYQVDEIIGIGGMGAVLGGTHLQLQQPVAIKILLPTFVRNRDVRGRFLQESRAAARLRSDHVTRTYDVGALENGLPYMVMERLEGINLADALQQDGPFEMQTAVGYVLQACEAVAEAHAAGIVHRDLKPANLFLANKPNGSSVIKVLDFGISKTVEGAARTGVPALTGPHSLLGSPHYMSPEQIRDSSEVDTRTDVWALGVVLYELLSQRMPFDANSLPHLYARILSESPLQLESDGLSLPGGLTSTILACMNKSREERIADVGVLAERLAPYGPPWADSSVEYVRNALESRQPGRSSSRPPLSYANYAPTPSRMESQTTIAVGLPVRKIGSRRAWMVALGGVGVAALAASLVTLVVAPGKSLASAAESPSATSMLVGLAQAHRPTAPYVGQQLAIAPEADVERAQPIPSAAPSRDKSKTGASTSAGKKAPEPGSTMRERNAAPTPVRDLKSITLID